MGCEGISELRRAWRGGLGMNKLTQPGGWAKSVNSALPHLVAPPRSLPPPLPSSSSPPLPLGTQQTGREPDFKAQEQSVGTVWGGVYPLVTSRKADLRARVLLVTQGTGQGLLEDSGNLPFL